MDSPPSWLSCHGPLPSFVSVADDLSSNCSLENPHTSFLRILHPQPLARHGVQLSSPNDVPSTGRPHESAAHVWVPSSAPGPWTVPRAQQVLSEQSRNKEMTVLSETRLSLSVGYAERHTSAGKETCLFVCETSVYCSPSNYTQNMDRAKGLRPGVSTPGSWTGTSPRPIRYQTHSRS